MLQLFNAWWDPTYNCTEMMKAQSWNVNVKTITKYWFLRTNQLIKNLKQTTHLKICLKNSTNKFNKCNMILYLVRIPNRMKFDVTHKKLKYLFTHTHRFRVQKRPFSGKKKFDTLSLLYHYNHHSIMSLCTLFVYYTLHLPHKCVKFICAVMSLEWKN